MKLSEYLAKLDEEEQYAFIKRVREVGSRTVDVYSANKPKEYDEERDSLDIDNVHAVYHFQGPGSSSHYHVLLLDYQYAYWADPNRRPVLGWIKSASKANRNWFKSTTKADGSVEEGPRHVFGSSVFDPETKERIFPGTQKKQAIDEVGQIEVTNGN